MKEIKLKTPEQRVKELEKALNIILKAIPTEVLKDQLNEDFHLITKALKK